MQTTPNPVSNKLHVTRLRRFKSGNAQSASKSASATFAGGFATVEAIDWSHARLDGGVDDHVSVNTHFSVDEGRKVTAEVSTGLVQPYLVAQVGGRYGQDGKLFIDLATARAIAQAVTDHDANWDADLNLPA